MAFAVLILFTLATGYFGLYQRIYHDRTASEHEAARKDEFEKRCGKITTVVELRRCFENHIEAGWETQRAQEDLYAQKQMADWAFLMLVVTATVGIPGLGISLYGILLVYENLKAARAGIDAMRALSAAENRGWIRITRAGLKEQPTFHGRDTNISVEIKIKNVGHSPVQMIEFRPFALSANESGASTRSRFDELHLSYIRGGPASKRSLFPGEKTKLTGGTTFAKNLDKIKTSEIQGKLDDSFGAVHLVVLYKIVGDDSVHETIRSYLVLGLDLAEARITRDAGVVLVPFPHLQGSTT
ncbi:hypothetical protein [Thalassobaculum sp.]|uniref:hypothetical protein n=1 Tax=Thalassobaculum sp. TaxID=2022740 RepID=UPI0032F082D7